MRVNEIIEEIKKLSPEEQQKIAVYLAEIQNRTRVGVSEQFKRAAGEVFRTNDELFRKLAQ